MAIWVFFVLYFVQGTVQAYLYNFQKPYLDSAHVPINQIAILSSVMLLPFVCKVVFGVISDRFAVGGQRRRPYMIIGLAVAALCYIVLAMVDPANQFPYFFILILLSACGMALFDSCADGFAIDVATKGGEGQTQASMMLGRGTGYILLSLAFGQMATKFGYPSIFCTIAGLIVGVALFVIFGLKEPARAVREKENWQVKDFLHFEYLVFGLYAILYSIPSFAIEGILTLFAQQELHMNSAQLGRMGGIQGVGGLIGTLFAGVSIWQMGAKRTAYLGLILLTAGGLGVATMKPESAMVLTLVWGMVWAFQETVFLTFAMQMSETKMPATFFALFMMLSNFGTMVGEWGATSMTGLMPFQQVFTIFALGNLLLLPLLYKVRSRG